MKRTKRRSRPPSIDQTEDIQDNNMEIKCCSKTSLDGPSVVSSQCVDSNSNLESESSGEKMNEKVSDKESEKKCDEKISSKVETRPVQLRKSFTKSESSRSSWPSSRNLVLASACEITLDSEKKKETVDDWALHRNRNQQARSNITLKTSDDKDSPVRVVAILGNRKDKKVPDHTLDSTADVDVQGIFKKDPEKSYEHSSGTTLKQKSQKMEASENSEVDEESIIHEEKEVLDSKRSDSSNIEPADIVCETADIVSLEKKEKDSSTCGNENLTSESSHSHEGSDLDAENNIRITDHVESEEIADHVKDDQIIEHVENDQITEHEEDDKIIKHARNDQIIEPVENDQITEHVENDQITEHVENDQIIKPVENDQITEHVENDQITEHVENDHITEHVQNDQITEHVKNDHITEHVENDDQIVDHVEENNQNFEHIKEPCCTEDPKIRTTAADLPDAGSIPQSPDDMSRNLKNTENIPQFSDTPKSAMSIAERLAALKKSEEKWRKDKPKEILGVATQVSVAKQRATSLVNISLIGDKNSNNKFDTPKETVVRKGAAEMEDIKELPRVLETPGTEGVKLRTKGPSSAPRPVSLADRMSKLIEAQGQWSVRTPRDNDAAKFTVEGKMKTHGVAGDSPLSMISRKPARPGGAVDKSPVLPTVSEIPTEAQPLSRTSSHRIKHISSPGSTTSPSKSDANSVDDATAVNQPVKVEVPAFDEESLNMFFGDHSKLHAPDSKVTIDHFDDLFINSEEMLITNRKLKPHRTKQGSRNPIKAMSARVDLQQEYTEVKTDIVEREVKRLKRERVVGTPQLAQEALAGLASKENFSQVALRKADSFHGTGLGERNKPYKEIMLLHVKGRRICQTRLVEPCLDSVNSGDCYVLVTPETVFLWMGKFSNIIEKAKASDVANQICQKHDLGVRPACQQVILDEEKQTAMRASVRFWKTLGAPENSTAKVPGPNEEDEIYESNISLTNKVYSIVDGELVLAEQYTDKPLSYDMLTAGTEVFVLDFGSEMYVWTGKLVAMDVRKKAVSLARELWNKGFDYRSSCLNPLYPLQQIDESRAMASERPPWALFAKISQNMETILFKEKFIDWPDPARLVRVKGRISEGSDLKTDLICDLKAFDAKKMIEIDKTPQSVILEGSHIGRGSKWEEVVDGIKWEYEMLTCDLDVWHVMEFEHHKMDTSSYGQFHEGDTYVVRWRYNVNQLSRTLKGEAARATTTGRNRCAYFFWQGQESSINEKGAAALMTVELDEERGPHVRVRQGKEPSCFIGLFGGHMVVHLGKRDSIPFNLLPTHRLFVVRNELSEDAYLMEIPTDAKNLRSRTSFLLIDIVTGSVVIWHGAKSSSHTKSRAKELATQMQSSCPKELGIKESAKVTISEIKEGSETKEFWTALGGRCSRILYNSLLEDPRTIDNTPRLFHMSSVSGSFEAEEIINPAINCSNIPSPFPFLQSDLYRASQPALFLYDNHHEVYIWQGWWPVQTEDSTNLHTGSADARFNATRKCAMETALNYCKELNASKPPTAYIVYAGCEPAQFTSLFPTWKVNQSAVDSAIRDNKIPGAHDLVADVLSRLCRTRYTFEELQQRPLPDGVDPLKLETYLADDEFLTVVDMDRVQFNALPIWKQTKLKQEVGLF